MGTERKKRCCCTSLLMFAEAPENQFGFLFTAAFFVFFAAAAGTGVIAADFFFSAAIGADERNFFGIPNFFHCLTASFENIQKFTADFCFIDIPKPLMCGSQQIGKFLKR